MTHSAAELNWLWGTIFSHGPICSLNQSEPTWRCKSCRDVRGNKHNSLGINNKPTQCIQLANAGIRSSFSVNANQVWNLSCYVFSFLLTSTWRKEKNTAGKHPFLIRVPAGLLWEERRKSKAGMKYLLKELHWPSSCFWWYYKQLIQN